MKLLQSNIKRYGEPALASPLSVRDAKSLKLHLQFAWNPRLRRDEWISKDLK